MKFSSSLALAATAAIAMADQVSLWTKSSNADVDGKALSALHEGAGFSYVFLADSDSTLNFSYDATNKTLSSDQFGQYPATFGVVSSYVSVGVISDPVTFTFTNDGTLQANGSSNGFYACKNTNDPYNWSQSSWELMFYSDGAAASGCESVTITKGKGSSGGSSSSAVTVSSATTTFSTQSLTTCPVCTSTSSANNGTTSSSVTTFEDGAWHAASANFGLLGGLVVLAGLAL
ncbi:hypothetical protein OGAPHI_006482 [Ogataea philodendri]|uniref:DUF7907 domain-containing protein n=1 Tax=Ogataea philodendri TaxID=1378263 RepID=A0A9P8NYN4_9ASCO|nr:uncharacterized protein OGAPHI_006482 [Ogataea philodendri]KAH3661632.1 hypothetical protein OGAPHI_006482 [Ogataea philodendri]